MAKPTEYYWVERKGGEYAGYGVRGASARVSKGGHGGTLRTLKTAQERRDQILRTWPGATVTIYRGTISWEEVN